MSWNNDPVFPIISEGFSWPSASSKTVALSSTKSSSFIVALTKPSLTPTKTGSSTFPIASFPTTKELVIAASYSSDLLDTYSAVLTSSVADITSNQVRQFATDVNHYSTTTKLPTGKNTYDQVLRQQRSQLAQQVRAHSSKQHSIATNLKGVIRERPYFFSWTAKLSLRRKTWSVIF